MRRARRHFALMDKTLISLDSHYKYWDDYVRKWCKGQYSDKYLPEPWWGWTPESRLPLRSVVINLHPGKGGSSQERDNIKAVIGQSSYREAMGGGAKSLLRNHLKPTDEWHSSNRARPIISRLHFPLEECVTNHLSIELSPIHGATSKGVEKFVSDNYENVVNHTLLFAADAAREIEGPLKGTVIVRCVASRFFGMFKSLGIEDCNSDPELKRSPYRFIIPKPEFEGVTFVCVWGARNFLPKKNLNKIINQLINQ